MIEELLCLIADVYGKEIDTYFRLIANGCTPEEAASFIRQERAEIKRHKQETIKSKYRNG